MKRKRYTSKRGYTLIEILVVIAIVATLLNLSYSSLFYGIAKAKSARCASNLAEIGQAVNGATTDNNGQYPEITQGGAYADYPTGSGAKTLSATLAPYGITASSLQCPMDIPTAGQPSYYTQTIDPTTQIGSSYEWSPALDDEAAAAPVLYIHGTTIPLNSNKVRLCMDFVSWHRNKMNRLYGDGHVVQN